MINNIRVPRLLTISCLILLFLSYYISDYVDEDDEDDEDDEEDGLMGDYSSVGSSIKFDSTNIHNINTTNKSNVESNLIRISANSGLQNSGMGIHEDVNVNHIQNDSRLSMTDLENDNESEGIYCNNIN